MDARAVIALLRARGVLASRDRWTRDELLIHQWRAFADLRAFALARSRFYRESHRGLEAAPLEALPVLAKATLPDGLLVLLVQPTDWVIDADVATSVRAALQQAGADNVRVRVERVDTIPRTALGKAPLVRAFRRERDDALLSPTPAAFST